MRSVCCAPVEIVWSMRWRRTAVSGSPEARPKVIDAASEFFGRLDPAIRFVVLGHTHTVRQSAVALENVGGAQIRRIYLNSDTCRPRHRRCYLGSGFVEWKEMAYCIIDSVDDRASRGDPSFETWSGTLET